MKANTVEDFWKKVRKTPYCWEWLAAKDGDGYGLFHYRGKQWRASRFVASILYQLEILGLEVCHTCDNPGCVRPSHLFIGTTADNAKDRDTKGRGLKGTVQTLTHIANRVNARLANSKKWSAQSRLHLSLKKLGTEATDEARKKMSRARAGVPRPDLSPILSGEGNGRAVMTESNVKELRRKFLLGASKASLSRYFGIGETQVTRIVTRKAWDHVD